MKNVQRAFFAAVFMLFFLVSAGSALADPQNYGMRAVRITSKCSNGLPDVLHRPRRTLFTRRFQLSLKAQARDGA